MGSRSHLGLTLGRSGPLLGLFWALLGRARPLLERSWGTPGSLLGALLALLRRTWDLQRPPRLHGCGFSEDFGFSESIIDSQTDGTWFDFIKGAVTVINKEGANLLGIDIAVTSDVPIASGLSSSAALEVSSLKALSSLANLDLDDLEIAKLGQKIEHEFIGTNCGIMDQLVSARAEFGEVLFIFGYNSS